MRRFLIASLLILLCLPLYAQITTTHGALKLVHAKATKIKQSVKIKINEPITDQLITGPDVSVKFSVENWKHFHFVLDNEPIQEHHSTEPFVFRNVSPGPHLIRVFPAYEWHESVKQQSALAMVRFYVKERQGNLPFNLNEPMMIYSAPVGMHPSAEKLPGQPHEGILIDWFLHQVTMGTTSGYLVRISVDGAALTTMKEWRPHYIQGLKSGDHKIKLELLKNDSPVSENWNSTERTITVR